jgi:hypothetical protein
LVKSAEHTAKTDENAAELEHVIEAMLSGQYNKPVRVVAFNTAEGWARDVSEDIAWEVLKRTAAEGRRLPDSTRQFTQFHIGEKETLLAENAGL